MGQPLFPGDDTSILVILECLFPCIHFVHDPSFLFGNVCLQCVLGAGCLCGL